MLWDTAQYYVYGEAAMSEIGVSQLCAIFAWGQLESVTAKGCSIPRDITKVICIQATDVLKTKARP